jgi:hypothetical protein
MSLMAALLMLKWENLKFSELTASRLGRRAPAAAGGWHTPFLWLGRGGGMEVAVTIELSEAGNGEGEQFVWLMGKKKMLAEELLVS